MAGTRNQVEGLPWYRAAVAVGTGVDVDAMDQIDTDSLVDRARCVVTGTPANAVYEYSQDSAAAADGFNVVAPSSNVGRWLLIQIISATTSSQAAWFVNSATGSDANDGLTALTALKTLRELQLRLEGKLILVSPVVTLAGTFPGEALRIRAILANGQTLRVTAAATVLYSGTLSGATAFAAPATWAAITDAGVGDYAPYLLRRLRLTDGSNAISWVLERTAATDARVAQFVDANYTPIDPVGTETYDIERLDVEVGGIELELPTLGGQFSGESTVENLQIGGTSRAIPFIVTADSFVKFFGCHLSKPSDVRESFFSLLGCYDEAGRGYYHGKYYFFGGAASSTIVFAGASLEMEGNFATATGAALFSVESGGVANPVGDHPFLGSNTASEALVVLPGGLYRSLTNVFGVDIATDTGINVYPGAQVIYNTKPTLAGTVNDTVIGNTPTAYAGVPYADPVNGARMASLF